jgi:hypothetical protein
MRHLIVTSMFCLALGWAAQAEQESGPSPILLPTGAYITPLAAPGAALQSLNPHLPSRPNFIAGQPVTTALNPDGTTLLVLTSGYNRNAGPDGNLVPAESNEYVFIKVVRAGFEFSLAAAGPVLLEAAGAGEPGNARSHSP